MADKLKKIEFPKEFHLADIVDFFIKGALLNKTASDRGHLGEHKVKFDSQKGQFYFNLHVPSPEIVEKLEFFNTLVRFFWKWEELAENYHVFKTNSPIMIDRVDIKKDWDILRVELEFIEQGISKWDPSRKIYATFLTIRTSFSLSESRKEFKNVKKYEQFISTIRYLIDFLNDSQNKDFLIFLRNFIKIFEINFNEFARVFTIQFNINFLNYFVQKYQQKQEIFQQFNPIFRFLWWTRQESVKLDSPFDFGLVKQKLITLFIKIREFEQIQNGEFTRQLKQSVLPYILTNKEDIDTFIDIFSNLLRLRIYLESENKQKFHDNFRKNNTELIIDGSEISVKFQAKTIGKVYKLTTQVFSDNSQHQLQLLPKFSMNLMRMIVITFFLLFFNKLENNDSIKEAVKYLVDKIILTTF